ncbi:MFS monocarboxylate transporter, putative [Talaromyces stipitatus ATCC 10500]|uniref:MFS monocarboxylate transporter, putative n=1 Tax=Talaromyces stipitatus (strain ATCC 10500 / CBS 375.48 / QM 6759 / NRRL 1006) TaxID=441959 RepID=B8LUS7_TALSN|nr:MFS monocarboxylate transporter, putative [Talaromyces stipitatus ATCC 10500]EED23934.1 MFS monocarboxylate transporter, putative [Talaromyces stipitatus ATCC 10500]
MEYELEHRSSHSSRTTHPGNGIDSLPLAIIHNDGNETSGIIEQQSLHPADTGTHAYLFLLSSFILEALIWGFAYTFGIFQQYYSTHPPFDSDKSNIAVIGTCSMGIIYIISPLVFGLLLGFPKLKRYSSALGLVLMIPALLGSSFANTTRQLLVSQGIVYAIGASFAYAPLILFMEEWFVKKRGFAFGIMWAGTGVSGVVLPLLMQWLMDTYGFRTTLRVWSAVLLVCIGPLLYFVKPRIPIAQSSSTRPFNLRFLRNGSFMIFQLGNIIQALGFFLPTIYLPTYATNTLGVNGVVSSLTVILFNLASVFGCIIMGAMVDRYHATTCILFSTIGSTISVFLIWGFSISLTPLLIFCVVYGIFAGSFSSTWPAIMREVKNRESSVEPAIVFAFLAAGRGIGNVASGPLSDGLLQGYPFQGVLGGAYGSGYGSLIVFTGVSALLGGLSVLARPLRLV